MSEVVANDCDVVAGLKERNGAAVSKNVGRYLMPPQSRKVGVREDHIFVEDVSDAVSAQSFSTQIPKDHAI